MACITAAVTFTVNYFYYILSPKSDWMVVHLNTQGQKQACLECTDICNINTILDSYLVF